jgi:chromosome partitioning protein
MKNVHKNNMVISIINLKGGAGKTTIATNLAVAFALDGKKVVLLDTDARQNSCELWGAARAVAPTIPVKSVTVESNLSKVVASELLVCDVVIIDGMPSLSTLAQKTIVVSDLVIIPIMASIYDLRAYEKFLPIFYECRALKETLGKTVRAAVLMNRTNINTILAKEIQNALATYDVPLLHTKLTNRVSYADSATIGQSVLEGKDGKAKIEMNELYTEIIKIIKHETNSAHSDPI